MSRSKHNGCGPRCGVCKPHKRWKTNGAKNANAARLRELAEKKK